jgi:hypothetical protein
MSLFIYDVLVAVPSILNSTLLQGRDHVFVVYLKIINNFFLKITSYPLVIARWYKMALSIRHIIEAL